MSRAIDALIAYRLLKLLVVPFKKTKAYQMGIIDEKGKVLIKSKDIKTAFKTSTERLAARAIIKIQSIMFIVHPPWIYF